MSEIPSPDKSELKKTLGLFALVAYGVGDTLGAGIYALVGKIAGIVGYAYWISFIVSLGVAALTALAYAELVSRYPHAGGEAHYSFVAFRNSLLSYVVGFLVLMSGLVSMAAVSHGFAGYLQVFFPHISTQIIVTVFFLVLAGIAFWGMRESSMTNIVCTAVEVSGILIIIGIGFSHFGKVNYTDFAPSLEGSAKIGAIFSGAVLAFYAFIGFEDMVKASEEAYEPEKNLPRAIVLALGIIGLLYLLTALSAVSVIPPQELSLSKAPLMSVVDRGAPWIPKGLFTGIALFAVTNTALTNYIMSSRLLYGMARDRLMPKILEHVNPGRHTPDVAVLLIFAVVLFMALTGTLTRLAQSTALLLLSAFFVVNLSLVVIKLRDKDPKVAFRVPLPVPIAGALTTFFLIFYVSQAAILAVCIILLIALGLFFLMKCRSAKDDLHPR
jgi:amino acid transporter